MSMRSSACIMLFALSVFIIFSLWGCGGGGSSSGSGDILGSDVIRDSQVATDSSAQDIQRDTEYQDIEDIKDIIDSGDTGEDIEADAEVSYDIADISGDMSDTESSDVIEDISDAGLDVSDISDCEIIDPKHIWSKSFGGSDTDRGLSVYVDKSGNVYITGGFSSSAIDFGGGALTGGGVFLAKFSCDGNHMWSKKFGSDDGDYGNTVIADNSGNIYLAGFYGSRNISFGGEIFNNAGKDDIFLAKFDNNGNHIWSKSFGGDLWDSNTSLFIDISNNIYITGYFDSSSINFGGELLKNAGFYDIYLAKFDSNGNHIWSKSFGGSYYETVSLVSVDMSGNLFLAGNFASHTIDFGGNILTNNGNGSDDIFLAKFDSDGNHKWSKSFGDKYSDEVYSIFIDTSGNVYITGHILSNEKVDLGGGTLTGGGFIAKFDGDGNYIWGKNLGSSIGKSIFIDNSGNIYVGGDFYGSNIDLGGGALQNAGKDDIFLAKFDNNGNHIWSRRFGGSNYDGLSSISVDSSGNVYGTGYFQSMNIDFGGCPLPNAGGEDIFFIKYAP